MFYQLNLEWFSNDLQTAVCRFYSKFPSEYQDLTDAYTVLQILSAQFYPPEQDGLFKYILKVSSKLNKNSDKINKNAHWDVLNMCAKSGKQDPKN